MNLSASEKKTLAILAVSALLYAAVIVGAAAFWGSRTHVDERPQAILSVGADSATIHPTVLCDYEMNNCDGDFRKIDATRYSHFPVPVGATLRVRLSEDVSGDPWSIVAQYLTPKGSELVLQTLTGGAGTTPLYLPSTRERVLINVEISLPAKLLAGDTDEELVRRGFFAIDTTPTGEQALLDAYRKAAAGKRPQERMATDGEFARR
ncbi:DUF2771 family protein [Gordonia crocea]|uniref:DUF2771 domain-containing protein n=1 Tax=Gordonia crocea TaxID=589162 RepID=A0A7I9UUT4_9ACTN|nr:DUF2771 family protein [Gordonia crocea]GED96908.1 hypothetical protein nbrc107697_09470 [Gordonia crocea]